MRRVVFIVLMLSVLLGGAVSSAGAQNTANIERLTIALWPEFDRAAVLVIYRISLGDDLAFPATVRVPIPPEVGDPHAVAYADASGQLVVAPYELEPAGAWNVLAVEAGSPAVQVEFYAAHRSTDGERSYVFEWPAGFGVGALAYEVQEPVGASDLSMQPPIENSAAREDGLTYHTAELGPLPEDQSFQLQLQYQKGDDRLTADALTTPVPQVSRPSTTEGGTPDFTRYVPWIIGGMGLLLLGTAGFLYVRSRDSANRNRPKPRRRSRGSSPRERPSEGEPSPVFCHQCGTRADASDRFCRHCGTRLRQ